jgi:SET domain
MFTLTESQPKTIVFGQSGFAEIRTDVITGNRSLFAKKSFQADEVICPFYWDAVYDSPTYLTVQIAENQHVELLPKFLECTNHSCEPNCFFDTAKKQFICLRTIKVGDELTFFYPSAEWAMDQPFECVCGSEHCVGIVRGAKYLRPEALKYHRFTDFIQQKLNK